MTRIFAIVVLATPVIAALYHLFWWFSFVECNVMVPILPGFAAGWLLGAIIAVGAREIVSDTIMVVAGVALATLKLMLGATVGVGFSALLSPFASLVRYIGDLNERAEHGILAYFGGRVGEHHAHVHSTLGPIVFWCLFGLELIACVAGAYRANHEL